MNIKKTTLTNTFRQKYHIYHRISSGGDWSWLCLRGSKKWILNHYFFYSLIPSFEPEINFKKLKIPVTRPNVLDTTMRILVLIELTVLNWLPMELFSKTTETFSKKTVFVASLTDITVFQRSQVRKSFLSSPVPDLQLSKDCSLFYYIVAYELSFRKNCILDFRM